MAKEIEQEDIGKEDEDENVWEDVTDIQIEQRD